MESVDYAKYLILLLFFLGGRHYDAFQFLGIKQIQEGTSNKVITDTGELETSGILGITRHPWYLAAILFIWLKASGQNMLNRIMSWFTIPGLMYLGFGMKYLAFYRPLLRYANEGVLPFFILHQTVLLFVGYFVMTWEINDTLKWAIVFISSFIIIVLLYMLLIRKFELVCFLFGMKTTHPFFDIFRKRDIVIILLVLYVALIVFAAIGAS
jgi:hypothetical protein